MIPSLKQDSLDKRRQHHEAQFAMRLSLLVGVLMLTGKISVYIDLKCFDLGEGDCFDFDVMRAVTFENQNDVPAKYIVIIRHK